MPTSLTPVLYIRLRKKIILPKGSSIYLGQIAQLLIDPDWEKQLNSLLIHEHTDKDGNLLLIEMLKIIPLIKRLIPDVNIEFLGQPHMLVEFVNKDRGPRILLLIIVCVLLFIGSGLAIMNFHADVSMRSVHQKLYTLITGEEQERPLLLQIPYSFGIGAGMMIFFNRVFKRKFNEEPNPLELEMYKYQESLDQYVVDEEYQKLRKRRETP